MSNTTNLKQVGGGSTIKQGDTHSKLRYMLLDNSRDSVDIDDEPAIVSIYNDYGKHDIETRVREGVVGFTMDRTLPRGVYNIEINVGGAIYPSDHQMVLVVKESALTAGVIELQTYDLREDLVEVKEQIKKIQKMGGISYDDSDKQIKNLLIWGSVGGNDVVDVSANNGRWLFRMLDARNLTFDNISVNAALGSGDHIFDCSGGQNIYIYNTIIRGGVVNWDGNDDLIRKELDRNWHDCLAEAIQFDYNYEGALGGFVVGDPERWQDREVYKPKKYDYSGVRNLHLDGVILSSFKGQRASDYLAKNGKIIHTAAGTVGSHVSPKVTETTVGLDIYVDNVHFENVATNKSNRGWGLEAPIHIQNPDERNTPNYRHDSLTVGTVTFNMVTRHNFGWAPNGIINIQSDMSVIYANISGNYAQEEEVHVDNPSGGSSSLHFYKKNNLVQVSLRGSWDVTQAGYNTARGVVPPRFRPVMSVFIGGVDSNSGRAFKIRFEPDGTIKTYTPSGTYTGLWLETSAVYLSNAM